jgi:hypothetical protein
MKNGVILLRVIRKNILISFPGIVVFFFIMLSTCLGWGQCKSSLDCISYERTIDQYRGYTDVVGSGVGSGANYSFTSGRMLLIPTGQTFTGTVSGNNLDNVVICIAEGGRFTPTGFNNFFGTYRLYNTTYSHTLSGTYSGNIENYGGTLTVSGITGLNNNKYILNCSGTITWNEILNIGNGKVYNNGQFVVTKEVSGQGCIFNENSMYLGTSYTDLMQVTYSGTLTLTNNGVLNIKGKMEGTGSVLNDGWLTVGNYIGANIFTNNGKVEIMGDKLYFNPPANVLNNCSFYSNAAGSNFQNNTTITNNGLFYMPIGTWENKSNHIFINNSTGVIRTKDLTNQGLVTGSGRFYVSGESRNENGGAIFGGVGDAINFYDVTNGLGQFDFITGGAIVGLNVFYTPFPLPEYAPDLSDYNCGDVIKKGSVDPGIIAASQTLCNGILPQPFISVADATVPPGVVPVINYQWQSSTDNFTTQITTITGATNPTYNVPARPAVTTSFRRKAKTSYPLPDTIKNAVRFSNLVTLTVLNIPPATITDNPDDATCCSGLNTTFSATAINTNSYRWQLSTDGGTNWSDFTGVSDYPSGGGAVTLTLNGVTLAMNNNRYRLEAINTTCGTVYSAPAKLTVNSLPTPTFTAEVTTVCAGTTGNVYTTQSGQSNYVWAVSAGGTITAGGTSTDNSVTVTWNTAGAETVSVNYQNAAGCTATSATVSNVTVSTALIASVTIAASANPFCTAAEVTFTATPTNGGANPTFQWKVNNLDVGEGGLTYSYAPDNDDEITCVMTPDASSCLTGSPATSNAVTMIEVLPRVVVSTATEKCPDTDTDLNFIALNSSYSPGNSSVTFTITRMTTGDYAWSFHYEILSDPVGRLVAQSQQPQPYSGDISVAATVVDPIRLTFYVINQTDISVKATLRISNVMVEGCAEAQNSNHSATIEVQPMPDVGPFITE